MRLSYIQVADEFQSMGYDLVKESKGYSCEVSNKFPNLQSAMDWLVGQASVTEAKQDIHYLDDQGKPANEEIIEKDLDGYSNDVPFAWDESAKEIEAFRLLLDHSWEYQSIFDLHSFAKQTVQRIAKLSRDWCLRECRGFMTLFGKFNKLTTRAPRKVMRRAKRFIEDVCKASRGMLHAQYTRGV